MFLLPLFSSYDIIIEILEGDNANKVERRTRKQIVQLPAKINDYETAIKNNENFYITANLDGNKLQSSAKFVVGDGGMYGGYRNQPLAPETGYMLHVRAVTVKDGVSFLWKLRFNLCESSNMFFMHIIDQS